MILKLSPSLITSFPNQTRKSSAYTLFLFLWLSSQKPGKITFSFISDLLFWGRGRIPIHYLFLALGETEQTMERPSEVMGGIGYAKWNNKAFFPGFQQKNLSSLRLEGKISLFYLAGCSRRSDSGSLREGLTGLQVPPQCRSIVRALHHHKLGRTAWPSLQKVRRFLAEMHKGLHGAFVQLDASKLDAELVHRVVISPLPWCLACGHSFQQ